MSSRALHVMCLLLMACFVAGPVFTAGLGRVLEGSDIAANVEGLEGNGRMLLAKPTTQGTASGTYFYDVKVSACPGGDDIKSETDSLPVCASNNPGPHQKTLRQLGSNNVVAIGQLFYPGSAENLRKKFCGKQVIATLNGKKVSAPDGGDFFVWDGCEACSKSSILDFSLSGLRKFNKNACTVGVVKGIKFQITDKQVKTFVP